MESERLRSGSPVLKGNILLSMFSTGWLRPLELGLFRNSAKALRREGAIRAASSSR